jgi:hypothetical protein
VVRGIPSEEIRVAKNPPAVKRRIGGKSFDEGIGADGRNGQNEQAGDGQRTDFFHRLIFQFCSAKNAERFLVERPARSLKAKTPPDSAKRGMKAFDEFHPAHARRTGLILLFAEKLLKRLIVESR